jgi:coproporphyrinogen III oxidase
MQQEVPAIKSYLLTLQQSLCKALQSYEGKTQFLFDEWERSEGGGGISAVLRGGDVFESAGVNFSHVFGESLPASATLARPALHGRRFEALGISSVIHPVNPFVPTTHMNVRFFVAYKDDAPPLWWFGGGFDLTPYYPFLEDVIFWHQLAQKACTDFGPEIYPRYKAWADKYFYLPHRQETRGVGGLFFDDLNEETDGWPFEKCFAFLKYVGSHICQAYCTLV